MKRTLFAVLVSGLAVLLVSSPARAEKEQDVTLADLPQVVMNAAMTAVPGIALTEAEIEITEKGTIYELEGEVDGEEYEIHIAADGTILGVETDDDTESEADDHDDDDHGHEHAKKHDHGHEHSDREEKKAEH